MPTSSVPYWETIAGNSAGVPASASPSRYMLLGLGLATWLAMYTFDGVTLVLPDMAGRFAAPQDPVEMATFGEARIASEFCQVRIGGDIAALKGVAKLVLEVHDEALRNGAEPVLDLDFIAQHTHGFEAFADDLRQTNWEDVLRVCGLPRKQLRGKIRPTADHTSRLAVCAFLQQRKLMTPSTLVAAQPPGSAAYAARAGASEDPPT